VNDLHDNALHPSEAAEGTASDLPVYPYPGLRPFRSEEAQLFFGREDHVDQLLEKLTDHRFVAVIGPSGCGKSSLVRAGLIPLLHSGFLDAAGTLWKIAQMRPGEQPFGRLARALHQGGFGGHADSPADASAMIEATLRRGPFGLADVLQESRLPPGTNLLVIVDQFEELFRYRKAGSVDDAEAFVNLLLGGVSCPDPIYVVITMRSDFLSDCALFSGLPEAMNGSQFLTPRLNRDQVHQAIVGPARLCRGELEPDLINRLINDMADDPDRLPLLQHVLMRMWTQAVAERGGSQGGGRIRLSLARYEAVGGFDAALSNHADSVYDALSNVQKKIAEKMFRSLCEHGTDNRSIRRPARLGEVALVAGVSDEQVGEVAEKFASSETSFIAPPQDGRLSSNSILDITHESLMTHWKKLAGWVAQESASALRYTKLLVQALDWEKKEIPELHGVALDIALAWEKQEQPSAAWAARYGGNFDRVMRFLRESEAARDAERRATEAAARRDLERQAQAQFDKERANAHVRAAKRLQLVLAVISFLLAVVVIAAVIAFQQSRIARNKSMVAEEQTRRAEAQTENVKRMTAEMNYNGYYAQALSRAQAYGFAEADKLLQRQLSFGFQASPEQRHSRQLLQQFVRMMSVDATPYPKIFPAGAEKFLASPDGKWLLTTTRAQAHLFDIGQNKIVRSWNTKAADPHAAAFDPHGKWLVTGGVNSLSQWPLPPDSTPAETIPVSGGPVADLEIQENGAIAVGFSSGAVSLIDPASKIEMPLDEAKLLYAESPGPKLRHAMAFDPEGNFLYVTSAGGNLFEWDLRSLPGNRHPAINYQAQLKAQGMDAGILRIGLSFHVLSKNIMFAAATDDGMIFAMPWKDFKENQTRNTKKFVSPERKGFAFLQEDQLPGDPCIGHGLIAYPGWNRWIAIAQTRGGAMLEMGQGHDGDIVGIAARAEHLWSCGSEGTVFDWHYRRSDQDPSLRESFLDRSDPDQKYPDKLSATATAISPDGSTAAVGFNNNVLRLYRLPLVAREKPADIPIAPRGAASSHIILRLDFAPDGSSIAAATSDGQIVALKLKPSAEADVHTRKLSPDGIPRSLVRLDPWIQIRSVAFAPRNPELLAFATSDGKFGICDLRTGAQRKLPNNIADESDSHAVGGSEEPNADAAGTFSARFDSDGKRLVTAGKTGVHLWDAQTGQSLDTQAQLKPQLPKEAQRYAVFSPTGRWIASGGPRDSYIHITDTQSSDAPLRVSGPAREVNRVEFGNEDSQLFVVGGDGRLHVFDLVLQTDTSSSRDANSAAPTPISLQVRPPQEIFSVLVTPWQESSMTTLPDLSIRIRDGNVWIAIPVVSRLAVMYLPGVYRD
jgi:WD40 repeat protein